MGREKAEPFFQSINQIFPAMMVIKSSLEKVTVQQLLEHDGDSMVFLTNKQMSNL